MNFFHQYYSDAVIRAWTLRGYGWYGLHLWRPFDAKRNSQRNRNASISPTLMHFPVIYKHQNTKEGESEIIAQKQKNLAHFKPLLYRPRTFVRNETLIVGFVLTRRIRCRDFYPRMEKLTNVQISISFPISYLSFYNSCPTQCTLDWKFKKLKKKILTSHIDTEWPET